MKKNIKVTINGVTINYMIYHCWGMPGYEIVAYNGAYANLGMKFATVETAEAKIYEIVKKKVECLKTLGLDPVVVIEN